MVKLADSMIKTATSHFVRLPLKILSINLLDCVGWNKRNKEDMASLHLRINQKPNLDDDAAL